MRWLYLLIIQCRSSMDKTALLTYETATNGKKKVNAYGDRKFSIFVFFNVSVSCAVLRNIQWLNMASLF